MCEINCSGGCPNCSPKDHTNYEKLLLKERIAHRGYPASEAQYGSIQEWEKATGRHFLTFYIITELSHETVY